MMRMPRYFAGNPSRKDVYKRQPLYTSYSLTTLTGNANFSHAKADRALGYTVRPFRETVADTIAWLKKAKRI